MSTAVHPLFVILLVAVALLLGLRRGRARERRRHTDENSHRVGEQAFGTNLGLRDMIGILLQDEKVPGVHIAFGDPYGSQTHANWKSRTHVDVLTQHCDVWIDDQQVIAEGQYLLDRFAIGAPDALQAR